MHDDSHAGPAPESATVPVGPRHSRWFKWLGAFVLGGSLLAVLVALVGVTLARYDIIGKLPGFMAFMVTMLPAQVLAALALLAVVLGVAMKQRPLWQPVLGVLLSGGLLYAIYSNVIWPAGNLPEGPPLHDITTDLADPPVFRTLTLRDDNLMPFQNEAEWKAAHRQAYPQIQPILVQASPQETLARARALAEERGWEIVNSDPAAGVLEMTASAGYIRFYDDVIVEATPVADGSTRVDMRSVSRVGASDLGYNAARITEFLNALKATR